MDATFWRRAGLCGSIGAALASCAQPTADTAFTVRKIEAMPGQRADTVRMKLTTPGDFAEADESLIVQYVQIVAVRTATERQRQVAATRARASFRKISKATAARPRAVRYLAVKTEMSAAVSPLYASAKASVMIWDTQTQEIVGNKVYDLGNPPPAGTVARFDTYTSEYVGSGL